MEVKIEKGIPLPPPIGSGRKSEITLVALALEIGDSFLIDAKDSVNARNRIQGASGNGRDFTIRKEGKQFRVWRIK